MAKKLKAVAMSKCLGCFTCMSVCSAANKKEFSLSKSAIRVRTVGGMSTRFIAIHCLSCEDPACASACPSAALVKKEGGGVKLISDKCIGCKECMNACSARAVNFDEDKKEPIICGSCGICAKFCPHQCIQMTEVD